MLLVPDLNARTDAAAGEYWAGLTALQIAVIRGYHGIVLLLLDSGALFDGDPSRLSLPTHLFARFPPLSVTLSAHHAAGQRSKSGSLDELDLCVRVADFPMLSLVLQASNQQGWISTRRPAEDGL